MGESTIALEVGGIWHWLEPERRGERVTGLCGHSFVPIRIETGEAPMRGCECYGCTARRDGVGGRVWPPSVGAF